MTETKATEMTVHYCSRPDGHSSEECPDRAPNPTAPRICSTAITGVLEPHPWTEQCVEHKAEPRIVAEPRACPGCDRIMSAREADEQGACNDCI